jgi:carboxypeptidase C (cathepsin A)
MLPAEPPAKAEGDEKKDDKKKNEPVVTKHSVTINGEKIEYTATAGLMPQLDDNLKTKANIFYVAYTKDGADPGSRPLLFSFNGGPGSSSVWLHMGTLGPRRVLMGDDGEALPPPGRLEDNAYSWLDIADLVFIDPVSTGFSRAAEGEDAKQFHGLDEDIQSVANFIRLYTTRNSRWYSPKFIIGESYGGTRAAGLSSYLQDSLGMYLNGVILVSPAVDFATLRFDDNNDLPYWVYLPTYTASAWYHKKLPPDLQADQQKALREAEQFASTDYLVALGRGSRLTDPERDAIATRIARLTGLSKEFVLRSNLRINIQSFCKELLRDQARTVGRFDSRYKGIDRNSVGNNPDYDPSYTVIQGAYTAGFNEYIRTELKYESDQNYEILTGRVNPWNFGSQRNKYPATSEPLRSAMTKNPSLKVFFAGGYYDLAVPYFATQYIADHLMVDASLAANISSAWYQGGHMYYLRLEDLKRFKEDGAAFIKSALPSR